MTALLALFLIQGYAQDIDLPSIDSELNQAIAGVLNVKLDETTQSLVDVPADQQGYITDFIELTRPLTYNLADADLIYQERIPVFIQFIEGLELSTKELEQFEAVYQTKLTKVQRFLKGSNWYIAIPPRTLSIEDYMMALMISPKVNAVETRSNALNKPDPHGKY